MSREQENVVVIGATGYTGRLVAAELQRQGQPVVLVGRREAALEQLASELGELAIPMVGDVTSPESLAAVVGAGDVVINCAGPFSSLGPPVVQACIEAGTHYLDISGEQGFIREVYARFGPAAAEAGVVVAPAMAFEYALGDCAVALVAAGLTRPLRSVDVIYAWADPITSRGTRRTVVRVLGRKGVILEDDELRRRPQGSRHRTVRISSGGTLHAVLFTSGEVLTVPRHVEAETVRAWAVLGSRTARILPFLAPALPVAATALRPIIERLATRRPDPEPAQREASRFTIRAEIHDRNGLRRAIELRGRDPYALTAAIAVAGARRVLEADAPRGVLAPAELMPARPFLLALARRGLRLVENG
jgi:short subunit dehydrogenase-like uncharacterized protein